MAERSADQLVCPRCGHAAEERVWCPECGLNLRKQDELPTAEAYAATTRERAWLARHDEPLDRPGLTDETTGASEASEPTEPQDRHRPAERRRIARGSVPILGLVFVCAVVAAWHFTHWNAPVLGADPFARSSNDGDESVASAGPPTTTSTQATPETTSISLSDAVAELSSRDFTPVSTASFDPDAPVQVLVGEQGRGNSVFSQAFFFADGRYLGPDTAEASQGLEFVSQDGDTVTLAYQTWLADDPHCCPTGPKKEVRYRWDGSSLTPLDPIPTRAERYAAPIAGSSASGGPVTCPAPSTLGEWNNNVSNITADGLSCSAAEAELRRMVNVGRLDQIPGWTCSQTESGYEAATNACTSPDGAESITFVSGV